MLMDKYINRILAFIFGSLPSGDGRVWFHSQNLTDGSWPYEGRCWLRSHSRVLFHFSWNLWTHFCGFGIYTDKEDKGTVFHIAFPPVSFWVTLPIHFSTSSKFWERWNERYGGRAKSTHYEDFHFIDVRIHDWTLWWSFLKFDWGWSHQMPKWMDGRFHPLDTLFGKTDYIKKELSKHDVVIPMPEGSYPATVEFSERTWKRQRLPWNTHKGVYASIDMKVPIPHEGKGEDSWNCGKDALYGLDRKASTIEQAVAATVETVLKSRRRYDGNVMAKYPNPMVAAA